MAFVLAACGSDGDTADGGGTTANGMTAGPGAAAGPGMGMPAGQGDTASPGGGDAAANGTGMGMPSGGGDTGSPDGAAGMDTAMGTDSGAAGGGSMTDDGAGGAGSDGGGTTNTGDSMREDLGMGDGSDVITIGDSYMLLLISGVRTYLESISGQNYRNYEFPGTRVLDGNIPGQYASAKAENPDIKTVVMTGGGNDVIQDPVMQSNCEQLNQACLDHMDRIGDAIEDLMMQMANDGVQDVVVVGYSYMTGADLDASLDHSRERYHETCKSDGSGTIPIRCHFVDPLELGEPLPISFDGIHPTEAGYQTLARYAWERMQAEGVRR